MRSNYYKELLAKNDAGTVLQHVFRDIDSEHEDLVSALSSRFYRRVEAFEFEGRTVPPRWQVVSERAVSYSIDTADLTDHNEQFYWLDDDFQYYPVTVGGNQRVNVEEECPFIYAEGNLIANGKVVGSVLYTDH